MPTKLTMATIGIRIRGGISSTRVNRPIIGMFMASSMKLAMKSAAISPQTTSGCWVNSSGPGRDVEGQQDRQQHGRRTGTGDAKCQHRNQGATGSGIVAGFRGCDPARIAGAEGFVFVDQTLFHRVGNERAERSAQRPAARRQ